METSPVAPTPPAPDDQDGDEDYGKSILGELQKLNGRLDQWGDLLTRETNTETSSDPATPETGVMPTRAADSPQPNENSPTSASESSAEPVVDSSSAAPTAQPTVDTTPPAPTPDQKRQQKTSRKSLGFLGGGGKRKRQPNP